jgi:hypothetical protein
MIDAENRYPICLDQTRACHSPACSGKKTLHEIRVYEKFEYRHCKICGCRTEARYRDLYYHYPAQDEIEKIRELVNDTIAGLRLHGWSQNLGKKDNEAKERAIERLHLILKKLNEIPTNEGQDHDNQ